MSEDPKLILGAYRPHGQDANDPAFAEALAATERDPGLAAWFREAREFDRVVADRLASVAVPESLRAKILAGGRASRVPAWRARPRLWAIAALLVALAGVAVFWMGDRSGLAPWQRHAAAVLEDIVGARVKLDRELPEPEKLVAWLQEQSAPVLPVLPDALSAHKAMGCKAWEWRGLKFAMVCFSLENSRSAHLVTTWHGGLKGAPPLGQMVHARTGKWNTATWSEGGLACMLLTDGDEETMRALLAVMESGDPPVRLASSAPSLP